MLEFYGNCDTIERYPKTRYIRGLMKSALLVWGGWEGHEPKQGAELFSACLREKGYDTQISDTLDVYLDADKLRSVDLIVPIWPMGTITKDQESGLLEAYKSGVGITGCHASIAHS